MTIYILKVSLLCQNQSAFELRISYKLIVLEILKSSSLLYFVIVYTSGCISSVKPNNLLFD